MWTLESTYVDLGQREPLKVYLVSPTTEDIKKRANMVFVYLKPYGVKKKRTYLTILPLGGGKALMRKKKAAY